MLRHGFLPLITCAAVLLACGCARRSDEASPAPANQPTIVRVDNQGFLDMTVYVLDGSQRIRLGIATGNAVTPFTLPAYLVQGATPLRFLCDPIGGSRTPVSNEIVVQPGDEVTLVVPAT